MIKVIAFDLDFTLYDENCECLYEGVKEHLEVLSARYDLALITNGSETNQRPKLAGIQDYFNFFYFVGFSSRYKPDPWAFEQLLQDSGTLPDEVIYVGNNPFTDFIPCKLTGIQSIRVCTDEYGERDVHDYLEADLRLPNISSVFEHIDKLSK